MRTHWCALLVMLGLLAPASEAGDWDGLVKEYVEAYESVKEPVPTAYPWVAKRLRTLFGVRGVGHIQVFAEKDGKRTLGADIYYKAGEVHIINHDKGWNLVTKGKEAYEWETGEKEGLITKLDDKDLIDYLLYLTDPSCIMTCFYHGALVRARQVPPAEGGRAWAHREAVQGAGQGVPGGLRLGGAGLALRLRVRRPGGGKPVRMIVSKPESLKEVPAGVFERLKGVEFKKSDLSIRRHMVYL